LASFQETHINAEIEPSGAEHLTYRVAVPKTWPFSTSFGPTPTGMLETRGLGFFAAANLPTAGVIATTATNVPYEIPLDAWGRVVFAHEGYEIVEGGWFPGPTGLFYDITGVRTINGMLEVRRSAVRVQGNEIICLNCMCSREEWDFAKEVFWIAMVTFELADSKPTRMEPWLRAATDDPAFELAHPASWVSQPVEDSPEHVSAVDVRLAGEDEKLLGYLQVRAERLQNEPAPSPTQLDASAMVRLKKSGFVPTEEAKPLTEDNDPRALSVKGWVGGFTGDGTFMGGDITTRRGFMERKGIVYSFAMLSPRTANNPLVALRTLRVFEIARATITALDESQRR
jgi:hypothetical protein